MQGCLRVSSLCCVHFSGCVAQAQLTLQRAPATTIPIVENQKCLVTIVRGTGDEFAAGKLADELRRFATHVPVVASGLGIGISEPATLYLGTLQSNPALAEVASALGWKSEIEKLPAEGYLIRTAWCSGKERHRVGRW